MPIRLALACLLMPALVHADALWSTNVGQEAGATRLVVTDGVVVAATWTSELVGLDARTGKVLWRQKNADVAGTTLLVDAAGGHIVRAVPEQPTVGALVPRTGKMAWTTTLEGPAQSVRACPGHRLVAVTHRGQGPDGTTTLLVHALDPTTGKTLWQVPAKGDLVGAGPGHLFVAERAGVGRLMARLQAIRCADGKATTLPTPARRFTRFLSADATHVASAHAEFRAQKQLICVTALADQRQTCFEATHGKLPPFPVSGALVKDGVVHIAANHVTAHNLDPRPDGWILRYDIEQGRITGHSPPLTSGGLLHDAGGQIVAGFGTTGIDDFAYLIDPLSGKRLASAALKKAPRVLTADAERAYIASYDGAITAMALVEPGRKARPEVAVAAQAIATPAKAPDLGWALARSFAAHPMKARTSGSMGAGSIGDLAFIDAERVVVGGNDDRLAVYDSTTGKRLWRSPRLRKDVQRVGACDGQIAAQVYGGTVTTFRAVGRRWRKVHTLSPGHGWAFAMASDCAVVVDDFDGAFKVFDPKSGKVRGEFRAPGVFDRRGFGIRGTQGVISESGSLRIIDVTDINTKASVPTPDAAHGGKLTQAWLTPGGRLLREYCGPAQCVVELLEDGAVTKTLAFDTTGVGWSPTVPSVLAVAPDGSTLVFFRRSLDLLLVDLATDKRQPLRALAGPQSGLVQAAFSPDGKRLAISGHPKSYEITVLTR